MDYLQWTKILTALASPLALCLVLLALGLLLRLRWKRVATLLMLFGCAWLFVWSLPSASLWLSQQLERQYPPLTAAEYPQVDAIVVLGGGVEGRRSGWRVEPGLSAAADRLWVAARLFRAGRAPHLVLSGGNTSWSHADQAEAEAMAELLVELGVPRDAMLTETRSLNTYENAVEVRKILEQNHFGRVLLVTSAQHMPRAMATFARAGVDAVAASADIEAVPPRESTWLDWIPDAHALDASSRALKEYAGLCIYRIRGWAA